MTFQIASTRSPFHLFYTIACLSKGFHSPWTPPINSSWQANDILTKLFWHDIILKQLKIKPLNFSYQFLFLTSLWNKSIQICEITPSPPLAPADDIEQGAKIEWGSRVPAGVSLIRLEFWHSCFSHLQINLCRIKTAASKRTSCTWLWLVKLSLYICASQRCVNPQDMMYCAKRWSKANLAVT